MSKKKVVLDTSAEDDDKKKRRGRKPKDKFAYDDVSPDKPVDLSDIDNNIIIKIPINCMELDKEFNLADNYIPKPFDRNENAETYTFINNDAPSTMTTYNVNHTKINEMLTDIVEPANKRMQTQVEILLEKKYKHTKQLALFETNCDAWPKQSEAACFWDCHTFDHQPWGIPVKYNYITGVFTLSGNFCSPNCAAAHLLATETNMAALWEKMSLLNLLYYRVYETDDNIIPAPDKLCLKLFGGPLTITEYRALTLKNNKLYTLNFPPCNTILPVLEETKKVANQDSYFIPADKKKQNKVQTELKIKRTRPITSNKNTLDNLILSSATQ